MNALFEHAFEGTLATFKQESIKDHKLETVENITFLQLGV